MASEIGDVVVYSLATADDTLDLTESTIPLDTEVLIDGDTYSTLNGVITVKTSGLYLAINHLAVDRGASGSNRTSGESFLHVNNTLVSGAYTDGYIRRNSSADEFSDTGYGIYEFSANDTVEARQLRINGAGSNGRILGSTTTYATANTALTLIKLDDAAACCILEGASGDADALTASDSFSDQTWTTQTRVDTGFTHTAGSADIQIDDAGKYIAVYSNSWERATVSSTRTGVYERLNLDGSAVAGSWDNNYIRGSQSSEAILRGNNSSATIIETTTANEILKLESAREAGAITCNRLPLKSRIAIYKLPASAKSGRATLSGTQNMASTTEVTFNYNVSAWMDTGLSLASSQITCTDASNYLMLTSAHSDTGVTRNEPWQWFQVNGTKQNHGTGSGYNRNSGGTQKTSPNVGIVAAVGASQAVLVRNDSLSSNGTANAVTSTSAFCVLDLATLASSGTPYTITADSGSYSVTGTNTGLVTDKQIVAGSGAYILTGTATDISASMNIDAESGVYSLSGAAANLNYTANNDIIAESGVYVVTGTDLGLIKAVEIAAAAGTYILTGTDVGFSVGLSVKITAESGVYDITGNDTGLTTSLNITAISGSYAITGSDAGLSVISGNTITAEAGSYTITGFDAMLDTTVAAGGDGRWILRRRRRWNQGTK